MAALRCVLDAPVTLVDIAFLIRLLQVQLAGTAAPRIVAGRRLALLPVRRLIPPIGGLDVSVLFVLTGLQALQILLR